MALIHPGKKAPAFSLKDQHGKAHRLADYAGRPVVLYFYPKDDTPGCTKEACLSRQPASLQDEQGGCVRREHPRRGEQGAFRGQIRLELSAAGRRRPRGRGEIWRLAEEVALRPIVHGQRADNLSDRSGWPRREAMGQRQGRRSRRGGSRSCERAHVSATTSRANRLTFRPSDRAAK